MKIIFFSIGLLTTIAITGFADQEPSSSDQPLYTPKASKPTSSRNHLMPGYNAPDNVAVRSSFSLNGEISFLYWMPMEDNLEAGAIINTSEATTTQGEILNFNFDYKPGFKVGIGYGLESDHWEFSSEYLRLHSTMTTTPNLSQGEHISPIILMPQISGTNSYDSLQETWHLTLDVLDAFLSRSYFNGTQLTFDYFFGIRGAWIYQNVISQFGSIGNTVREISTASGLVDSTLKSDSWAVGPRVGLQGNWILGKGIRIYGNGAADLLFTRYSLSRKEFSSLLNLTYNISQKMINTLRTHLDLELGFGWGTHFCDRKWHLDLSAGYGFQVFFNQNMFRSFYNANSFVGETPHGNLYIQGLNITAQLDF